MSELLQADIVPICYCFVSKTDCPCPGPVKHRHITKSVESVDWKEQERERSSDPVIADSYSRQNTVLSFRLFPPATLTTVYQTLAHIL